MSEVTRQLRAVIEAAPRALAGLTPAELDTVERLADRLQSTVISERVRRHALAAFGTDTEEPDTVTSSGTLPVVDGPVTEVIPQVQDEHAPTSASE
jgi:hypothetical protein